jgi:hypothetical protein
MANRKKKVTEDTLVYFEDIRGTIDFLKEDLHDIESALGLNDITRPEGGYRKVDDPDAFEKKLNDIVNQMYEAHMRLQSEIFPQLGMEQQR